MKKVYVRELKPYSLREVAGLFGTGLEESRRVINRLILRGVVRYRNIDAPDGVDFSDEAGAKPDELYVFNYVGLAMVGDLVLIAYPKYFRDRMPDDAEIAQLFRALGKDSGRKTLISYSTCTVSTGSTRTTSMTENSTAAALSTGTERLTSTSPSSKTGVPSTSSMRPARRVATSQTS